MFKVKIK